jgi:hypothetical protein
VVDVVSTRRAVVDTARENMLVMVVMVMMVCVDEDVDDAIRGWASGVVGDITDWGL